MRHANVKSIHVVIFIFRGHSTVSLAQNLLGSSYNFLTAIHPSEALEVDVVSLNEGTPAGHLRGEVQVRVESKPLLLLLGLVLVVCVRFRCNVLSWFT